MPTCYMNITDREKAAILALRMGIIPDPKSAYIAAHDSAIKDVPIKSINSYVSKWMHSDKVVQFTTYIDRLLADRDADARQRAKDELAKMEEEGRMPEVSNRTSSKPRLIDYSDPANRKRLYNEVIRDAAGDPKTRLDAAKVFEQIQRDDKQAARENQVQRFYMPINCKDCVFKTQFAKLRSELKKTASENPKTDTI